MKHESHLWWRRMIAGNLIAASIVLFFFSGATFRTPVHLLARNYAIALLFSFCIGPLLGLLMPRLGPLAFRTFRFPLNWIVLIAAMVVLAMAGSVLAISILVVTGFVPAHDFGDWFRGSLRIAIAVTLTMGLFITAYEVMKARVAQATAEAQLASLESRVQPHFLFNTLNSIAALIPDDPKGAERMTTQLASLLRSSLDRKTAMLVPLGDELRTVRDYLEIERVRLGARLRYDIRVDDDAAAVRVPRLIVQTLVENSVKYAVSPRREGAAITVRAAKNGQFVHIRVEDDGPGFDDADAAPGHGIALVRERLALAFNERAALRIDGTPGATIVALDVPMACAES